MHSTPSTIRSPGTQQLASLPALFATLALSACGGNGDDITSPPVAGTPVSAPAVSTTFSGFKAGIAYTPNATVSFEGSLTSAGL
jgi:hypothetical protein